MEKMYRLQKFSKTISRKEDVDWWDYQWDFARYVQSGLAIVPAQNLVKNIGFGGLATHTQNGNSKSARMEAFDMEFPMHHPPFMIRDIDSDRKYFKNFMKDVVTAKVGL